MFFFYKQKTAYEVRISDWSSDVCSSDLHARLERVERMLFLRHAAVADREGVLRREARQDRPRPLARLHRLGGEQFGHGAGGRRIGLGQRGRQIGTAVRRERVGKYV